MVVEESSNVTVNIAEANPENEKQPSNEVEGRKGVVAEEEKSNATKNNTEDNPQKEKQTSGGFGRRGVEVGKGLVSENEKSNGTLNATESEHPENENQTSNGGGKQETKAAKDMIVEEDQSTGTLSKSEADENENQPSKGEIGNSNDAENNSKPRDEDQEKKLEVVQEKGKEAKNEIEEVKQKDVQTTKDDVSSEFPSVLASSSYREKSDYLYHLKEFEKKALYDLRAMVQEAILENRLIKKSKVQSVGKENFETVGESIGNTDKDLSPKNGNVKLWGVPFCASKADSQTDTILLMFLRAREFIVNDAFDMLRNTLKWRKDNNIDSILSEDFGGEFDSISYMNGRDRENHPICYNVIGALDDQELYDKALGTQEKREKLVRWRIQLMEKTLQELDFKPGGVTSFLQITDLKGMPAPSRKDFRIATRETIVTLQDNYPEFVAKNVFINVPFWYYAFSAVLSPFLSQGAKDKFIFARPNKVAETLLKYVPAERLPLRYGGLFRESDTDFSTDDATMEISLKAGSVANIEIPAPEAGTKIVWDLFVLGWEVNYKEEFIPTVEESYSLILQRKRKIDAQEGPIRNSFSNSEPGNVVLTVENGVFKKKNLIYRYKIKNASSS